MGQVQNGCMYIRYRRCSMKSKGEECKELVDNIAMLFYSKIYWLWNTSQLLQYCCFIFSKFCFTGSYPLWGFCAGPIWWKRANCITSRSWYNNACQHRTVTWWWWLESGWRNTGEHNEGVRTLSSKQLSLPSPVPTPYNSGSPPSIPPKQVAAAGTPSSEEPTSYRSTIPAGHSSTLLFPLPNRPLSTAADNNTEGDLIYDRLPATLLRPEKPAAGSAKVLCGFV